MHDEGYFSPFHRHDVVNASSMIPTKKVGDIFREAWGQSLRVGKDSCLSRHIWSAGINRWSGVLEEWMQVFEVGCYCGGDRLDWMEDRPNFGRVRRGRRDRGTVIIIIVFTVEVSCDVWMFIDVIGLPQF